VRIREQCFNALGDGYQGLGAGLAASTTAAGPLCTRHIEERTHAVSVPLCQLVLFTGLCERSFQLRVIAEIELRLHRPTSLAFFAVDLMKNQHESARANI
jgi:hypothetical protein